MEWATKITLSSSMIPRLYLFLNLALRGGGHIGFLVMWSLSACLSAQVNRSYSKHGIRHKGHLFLAQSYQGYTCSCFLVAAILDLRSCELWVHFQVHTWIDHAQKHGIRHGDQLHGINDTKVMRVFNFGYFGSRPSWKWLQKLPSRFFPPRILVDLITRPPKDNKNEGLKTIPIFSRFGL